MKSLLFSAFVVFISSHAAVLAMDEDKVTLNKSAVLRAVKSKHKILTHGKRRFKVAQSEIWGNFGHTFLNDPDSLKGQVTFTNSRHYEGLCYSEADSYYATPAEDQLVIDGAVIIELNEI